MEITGTVHQVLFFEKEKGYCILKIKEKETNKIYTVTGTCTELQILEDAKKSENLPCYVVGELHNHPKYGEQIKASLIRIETMGLRFFLSNMIQGVKPSFAYELLKHHTEQELIEALDNDPEKFGEISGLKGRKLKYVINAWSKYKTVHDLVQFFAEHNIPINLGILTRIYNYYGANAINVIKQSPYSLTSIKGIGFKTTDKIALGLGVPTNSPERIKALMNYILKEEA
ncbi:MAG TPA: hypothetical protein ENO30_02190, partial [Thermodesulfobium narugense]|nr:hypothetical protein [Thermodesulfobium narugense]